MGTPHALTRFAAPVRLVNARLGRRRGPVVLVCAGLGAAAALLALVVGAGTVVRDASISRSVDRLPASSRAVRAVWFGVGARAGEYGALDRDARAALAPVSERPPTAVALFRESTIAGSYVGLGGVAGLGRWLRLSSGRLPRPCTLERCEVLQLRGTGRIPSAPGLRLVRVGRGQLVSGVLFGDAIPPARSGRAEASLSPLVRRARAYHRPPPAPLLLAEGVEGLARSPVLDTVYRSYSWVIPLEGDDVHPWTLARLSASAEQARSTLQASSSFELEAPLEELAAAGDRARAGGRRLLVLGGEGAALLLAFVLLAATRLRGDADAARRRLTWLGASRGQQHLAAAWEALVVTVPGVALGWISGTAAVAVVARAAGSPALDVVRSSVASSTGVALAACTAAVAALALFLALTLRPFRAGGASITPLDVAALGALGVIAVTLARGPSRAADLAGGGELHLVLLLLPLLVALVAGVAVARLLAPALRLLARAVPERRVAFRLAAVSLARSPGSAAVAVAFLTASLGLALFAVAYRSTLVGGQSDQAAFAVPADVVLREELSRLVPVSAAATPAALRSLGADVEARPVIRAASSVSGRVGATGITVLGLDPDALPSLDGWRSDFSSLAPRELASRIRPPEPAALRGIRLDGQAESLALRVGDRGPAVSLVAYVVSPSGAVVPVELGRAKGDGSTLLRAALPDEARGGTLFAIRVVPPPRLVERGADAGQSVEADLELGSLEQRTPVGAAAGASGFPDWLGAEGVEVRGLPTGTRLHVLLSTQAGSLFRARQVVDERPVPLVASPRLAALADRDGTLPLEVGGARIVGRVVATARRFPGAGSEFAVADRRLLAVALDASSPGSARVAELWIDTRTEGAEDGLLARLRRPPFDVLGVDSRRALLASLADDPIARGSVLMLAAAAIVALVLALAGLALAVLSEVRDDRGDLADLEAQGADPAVLRRQVRLRAAVVAVAGALGGIVAGVFLAALVVRLVALTASASPPEPPLRTVVGWPAVGLGLLGFAVLAAIVVGATTRAAFRSERVSRPTEAHE